jgi:hypothetical protein
MPLPYRYMVWVSSCDDVASFSFNQEAKFINPKLFVWRTLPDITNFTNSLMSLDRV